MNQKRDVLDYLNDMYDAINKGISFIENMTFEEFSKDEKTQFALIRSFEIIGEASKKFLYKSRTNLQKFLGERLAE